MKKTIILVQVSLALVFLIGLNSCRKKVAIPYNTMHVYTPEELQKFIDNSTRIEKVGTPTYNVHFIIDETTKDTIGTNTISTQLYLVYVALDKDRHLILDPGKDSTGTTARMIQEEPIPVFSGCSMYCTSVLQPDGSRTKCPDAVCDHTGDCSCSGDCGSTCVTTSSCKNVYRAGVGFGTIMM